MTYNAVILLIDIPLYLLFIYAGWKAGYFQNPDSYPLWFLIYLTGAFLALIVVNHVISAVFLLLEIWFF